jgi:hypothetical protein
MSKYAVKEDLTREKYARKKVEELETRPEYLFKNNGAVYTG